MTSDRKKSFMFDRKLQTRWSAGTLHSVQDQSAPRNTIRKWSPLAAVAFVLALLGGCGCQPAPSNKLRVLVVGDSLAVESSAAIKARVPGAKVVARTGAAPCDMLNQATREAKSADVVVLAFSGNGSFLSNCMTPADDFRVEASYKAQYTQYASKIGASKLRMALTPVWGDVNARFSQAGRSAANSWAKSRGIPTLDAAAQLGKDSFLAGDFRKPGEKGIGDKTFVSLRSADRVHLCVAPGYKLSFTGPSCPTDTSAGVNRFATGIMLTARS